MEPEAVDRIVSAVGSKHVPPMLDRAALANDLEWSADLHAGAAKRGAYQRERLRDILKKTKQLGRLLADDDAYRVIYDEMPGCPRLSTQHLIKATQNALASHPAAAEESKALALAMSLDKRNEFDWLVGERLSMLFERHFKARAGLGRNKDGAADSPFVRFAEAALIELGIKVRGAPYSRGSIVKAVTNVRTDLKRRKARPGSELGKTHRKD